MALFVLHKAQYLFWFNLAFIGGIAQISLYFVLLIIIPLWIWYKLRIITSAVLVIVMIMAWSLGNWRINHYLSNRVIPYNQTISFTGYVSKPPYAKESNQVIYLVTQAFPGKVYLKTKAYPVYHYGEEVTVQCRLIQPTPFKTFAFDKYLARYGALSICQQPHIYSTGKFKGNLAIKQLYEVRNWFEYQINQLWPEPVASLLLGVILGIQDHIPEEVNANFRQAGVIHVLVVSGMHVMLLAQVMQTIGKRWLAPRFLIWVITAVLIGFAIITGLAAAVVRAVIMGVLSVSATAFGRKQVMHFSLAFVAASMVLVNPYILRYDAGFQLSFLATLGLIYFQRPISRWCKWLPQQFGLRENLSTTLAATLTTLPLLALLFKRISLVSPMANLIILPVSNLMLFAGIIIVLLNLLLPALARLLAYALWLIVSGALYSIDYLANLPIASSTVAIPLSGVIVGYLIMIAYILWQQRAKLNMA